MFGKRLTFLLKKKVWGVYKFEKCFAEDTRIFSNGLHLRCSTQDEVHFEYQNFILVTIHPIVIYFRK